MNQKSSLREVPQFVSGVLTGNTHLTNSADANVLIVDEPEIYLHPDLQHQLFHLLKATEKQVILATHSAEMVNEAEHDDVIIVNKAKRSAARVADIEGLQEALFSIGSAQNIHLARLSRGRKILFLEGNDHRLLRRLAARLGLQHLAESINITIVPIGGFGQRQKIEHAAWTFEKVLKSEIAIAAVLDRDYRCAEEIEEITRDARATVPHFHILVDQSNTWCPRLTAAMILLGSLVQVKGFGFALVSSKKRWMASLSS